MDVEVSRLIQQCFSVSGWTVRILDGVRLCVLFDAWSLLQVSFKGSQLQNPPCSGSSPLTLIYCTGQLVFFPVKRSLLCALFFFVFFCFLFYHYFSLPEFLGGKPRPQNARRTPPPGPLQVFGTGWRRWVWPMRRSASPGGSTRRFSCQTG